MNELIKVVERDGEQAVSARDLHEALEVGRDFSNWIKDRIEKYGFVEDEDYSPNLANSTGENLIPQHGSEDFCSPNLASKNTGRGGHNKIDYLLSVGTAKEIAIVENNDIGRKIRRYLIKVEEEFIAVLKRERQAALEREAVLRSLPPYGSPQSDYPYKFFLLPHAPQALDALSRAVVSRVMRRSEFLAIIMGKSEEKAGRESRDAILQAFIKDNIILVNDVNQYVVISEAYERYR
jgi:phage anti-repressor protein